MKNLKAQVRAMSMDFPSRDAGSRGEELASEALADEFYSLGLKTDIDGFTCAGNLRVSRSVYLALLVVAGLMCFLIPSARVVALLLGVAGVVLTYLSYNGKDFLGSVISKFESQNVIARYVPEGMPTGTKRTKVVIVAHYDVKKPSIFQLPAIRGYYKIVRLVIIGAGLAVPVCCLLCMLPFPEVLSTIFAVIALIAAIVVLVQIVDLLLGAFLKTPKGANCNASGLAAMQNLAKKLVTSDVKTPDDDEDDSDGVVEEFGDEEEDFDDYGEDLRKAADDDADEKHEKHAKREKRSGRRKPRPGKKIETGLESVLEGFQGASPEATVAPEVAEEEAGAGVELDEAPVTAEAVVVEDGGGASEAEGVAAAAAASAAAAAAAVAGVAAVGVAEAEPAAGAVEAAVAEFAAATAAATADAAANVVETAGAAVAGAVVDGNPAVVSRPAVQPVAAPVQPAQPRKAAAKPSWWSKVEDEKKRGEFDRGTSEPTLRSLYADAPASKEHEHPVQAEAAAVEAAPAPAPVFVQSAPVQPAQPERLAIEFGTANEPRAAEAPVAAPAAAPAPEVAAAPAPAPAASVVETAPAAAAAPAAPVPAAQPAAAPAVQPAEVAAAAKPAAADSGLVVSFGESNESANDEPASEPAPEAASSQDSEPESAAADEQATGSATSEESATDDKPAAEAVPAAAAAADANSTVAYTPRPVSEVLSELDESIQAMDNKVIERKPMPERPEPYQEPLVEPSEESSAGWPTGSYKYSRNRAKYRRDEPQQPSYDSLVGEPEVGVLDFSRERYKNDIERRKQLAAEAEAAAAGSELEVPAETVEAAPAEEATPEPAPVAPPARTMVFGAVQAEQQAADAAASQHDAEAQAARSSHRKYAVPVAHDEHETAANVDRASLLNLPVVGSKSMAANPNSTFAGGGGFNPGNTFSGMQRISPSNTLAGIQAASDFGFDAPASAEGESGYAYDDAAADDGFAFDAQGAQDAPLENGDMFISREDVAETPGNLTGAFAPLGASGVMQPVTAEMLEQYNEGQTLYVDDAEDDYESGYDDQGAYVSDLEIEMPKRKLFGRRKDKKRKGRKGRKNEATSSANEWLGVDENYNATQEGARIGTWDNFSENPGAVDDVDTGQSVWDSWDDYDDEADWRGGAYGGETEEQNRDAVDALSDELLNKEVWFVALGASDAGSAGMENLLRTHEADLKNARIVNLECIGAGELCFTASEQVLLHGFGTDPRMQKLVKKAAHTAGVDMKRVKLDWRSTEATPAIARKKRAITITALENGTNPGWKWGDDNDELVSEGNLRKVARVLVEIVKAC